MRSAAINVNERFISLDNVHDKWTCREGDRVAIGAVPAEANLVLEAIDQTLTESPSKSPILVVCDKRLGADAVFRAAMHARGIIYMAKIPGSVSISMGSPAKGVPPVYASSRIEHPDTDWDPPRYSDGRMYRFARERVYTIVGAEADRTPLYEWLILRHEVCSGTTLALSNLAVAESMETLRSWYCLLDAANHASYGVTPEEAFQLFQLQYVIVPEHMQRVAA